MKRLAEYRKFRRRWSDGYQMSRLHAFKLAFWPLRLTVVLHVLQDRPTIYRVHYDDCITIDSGNSNLLVAGCTVDARPKLPMLQEAIA